FVFFSLSRSKLPPYLFPAIPAAAALAALAASGASRGRTRTLWIVQAVLATVFAAVLLLHPTLRAYVKELRLAAIVAPSLALLVVGSWTAVLFAERSSALASTAVGAAWAA